MSLTADAYISSLPEVETARLPKGALFVANKIIYQVIDTSPGGFSKARQWRHDEKTDVALIPNSFPTKYLPLVRTGRILPVYRSRSELLTANGEPSCFVFPTEMLSLDAAYLDVALIMSAGAYVRNHNQEPALVVTDGVHIFRLYYYLRSAHGRSTHIGHPGAEQPRYEMRPHSEGPGYWRLLSSWQDAFPPSMITQPSMPVVKLPSEGDPDIDKTRPNITLPR